MTPKMFPNDAFPVGVHFKQLVHTQSKIKTKKLKKTLETLF